MASIIYIEPFYGGSHQQLIDLLAREFPGDLYTMPATKWHWRMRTSALHFSMTIPHQKSYRTLFASSVLNLCELASLRPDLAKLHKVLYFHENQLVYPVRKHQDRDFQYGYNEILSCLVADTVLFNSRFNMNSFLESIDSFLKLIPDHRPKGVADMIRTKCSVLYFPLELRQVSVSRDMESISHSTTVEDGLKVSTSITEQASLSSSVSVCFVAEQCVKDSAESTKTNRCELPSSPPSETVTQGMASRAESTAGHSTTAGRHCLHIVWPHRWEHDKGPDEFAAVVAKLLDSELEFRVSILGSHTNDIPVSFTDLFPSLGHRLVHKGPVPKSEYWDVLRSADVVVSTSKHEFFGVSMLEAVASGCYPLCPNRLVYPELYPDECLYNTDQQLYKKLKRFCQRPSLVRRADIIGKMPVEAFNWENLKSEFRKHLNISHKHQQTTT